jgi:hypothetical protein
MRAGAIDRVGRRPTGLDAWAESLKEFDRVQGGAAAGLPGPSASQPRIRRARNQHTMSGRPGVNERNCPITDIASFAPRSKSAVRAI